MISGGNNGNMDTAGGIILQIERDCLLISKYTKYPK